MGYEHKWITLVPSIFFLFSLLTGCNRVATTQKTTLHVHVVGQGVVYAMPGNHVCEGKCAFDYPLNTQVWLKAEPKNQYFFSGWDVSCKGFGVCELILRKETLIAARFEPVKGSFRLELENDTVAVPRRSNGGFWAWLNPSENFNVPVEALEVTLDGVLIGDGADQVDYKFLPELSTNERIFVSLSAGKNTRYSSDLVTIMVGVPGLYQTEEFLLKIVECGSCEE